MFYWDPRPEIFTIPFVGIPILWYGALFTTGFFLGFFVFVSILRRFFLSDPEYMESDILCPEKLTAWGKNPRTIVNALNAEIHTEEVKKLPERIKKFVEKSNPLNVKRALVRMALDLKLGESVLGIYIKATQIADRIVIYMLVATIVGARLGHYLFYENPREYIQDPLQILRVWEGGLASHGASVTILFALFLCSRWIKKSARGVSWVRLLDFISVPTILCGSFIRLGNFFNQEILGTPTSLAWGVVFGHPSGGPRGISLHPVQLYESSFYFLVFLLLWRLSFSPRFLLAKGKLVGLFFTLVFGFRFLVEFLKFEQSQIFSSALTMGQILSIPLVFVGFVFYLRSK